MTQEEKELLLKDICARLSYGTIASVRGSNEEFQHFHILGVKDGKVWVKNDMLRVDDFDDVEVVKPYLHPISIMTEEEQLQLGRLLGATSYNLLKGEYSFLKELLEYVYKNHIDLFGLIPKGLALEAPEDMYKN